VSKSVTLSQSPLDCNV